MRSTGRRRFAVVGFGVCLLLAAGCGNPVTPSAGSSVPTPSGPSETTTATPTATTTGSPAASPSASSPTPSTTASPTAAASSAAPAVLELPRGGRTVFPRYRLVGYAGLTGSTALGRLGIGDVDDRMKELESRAKPYAGTRTVLPTMEVITSIVSSEAGSDGKWRNRLSDATIQRYLTVARRHQAMLLLAIQPGRSSFLAEAKAYEKFLRQPDVGLALDPEWAMHGGQVPGRTFGWTTGADLDRTAAYLADLVADNALPEKVMVYHQLAPQIVRQESGLKQHRGVALVKSVDGIGRAELKINTYDVVNRTTPDFVHAGFKLFYEEDREHGKLMTPAQVLALTPRPDYVMYE